MITIYTNRASIACVYGVNTAIEMTLRSLSTNEVFTVPVTVASTSDRYGLYCMEYDSELPLNTGELIDGVTHFNAIPGKYIYNISDSVGIFYLRELEKENIVYEQENNTKTYRG